MPLEGLGPSIPYGQRILSASRIPVPTQGHSRYSKAFLEMQEANVQTKLKA